MKEFIVKVEYWHESFGGNDHRDGEGEFFVMARNRESAKKKGLNIAQSGHSGWVKLKSITDCNAFKEVL